MNKLVKSAALACAAAALSGGIAMADAESAIKGRHALMQTFAFNVGQLAAMAKGDTEFNAEVASAAANNLLAAANMSQIAMWPEGSDNASMPGKTRALPEIWSTYPAITEKAAALKAAAEKLASMAGNDLDGLRATIGPVGQACGGCHQDFRAK